MNISKNRFVKSNKRSQACLFSDPLAKVLWLTMRRKLRMTRRGRGEWLVVEELVLSSIFDISRHTTSPTLAIIWNGGVWFRMILLIVLFVVCYQSFKKKEVTVFTVIASHYLDTDGHRCSIIICYLRNAYCYLLLRLAVCSNKPVQFGWLLINWWIANSSYVRSFFFVCCCCCHYYFSFVPIEVVCRFGQSVDSKRLGDQYPISALVSINSNSRKLMVAVRLLCLLLVAAENGCWLLWGDAACRLRWRRTVSCPQRFCRFGTPTAAGEEEEGQQQQQEEEEEEVEEELYFFVNRWIETKNKNDTSSCSSCSYYSYSGGGR